LSGNVELDEEVFESCKLVHATWNEITRTWTLPTIHAIGLKEPTRFNELKRRIEGISATSLAERLDQLERFGVIQRKVFPASPPKVEYSLTVKGHEVYKILCALARWSERWAGKEPSSAEAMVQPENDSGDL
jgi:DNA-binding HxlR family transcriptional regulator